MGAASFVVASSARAASYSENFESYSAGAITTQNAHWVGGNSEVQASPGGADGHNNVLLVGDSEGLDTFPTPFTGTGTTLSFDLYQTTDQRRSLFLNEVQGPGDSADGPFMAWGTDGVSNTVPDIISSWQSGGFNLHSAYTWPTNTWQHVVINANNSTSTYSMTIDGNPIFTDAAYRGTLAQTDSLDLAVWFDHTAYIDNINVTDLVVPEPASIALIGALATLQFRRRRVR